VRNTNGGMRVKTEYFFKFLTENIGFHKPRRNMWLVPWPAWPWNSKRQKVPCVWSSGNVENLNVLAQLSGVSKRYSKTILIIITISLSSENLCSDWHLLWKCDLTSSMTQFSRTIVTVNWKLQKRIWGGGNPLRQRWLPSVQKKSRRRLDCPHSKILFMSLIFLSA